ncbi:MAG: CBS domain-containing protein [Candidatus Omnitrophica bacterium]|nr:CBS domain-containing protein [Candidatus Omnitrophota bacterium]
MKNLKLLQAKDIMQKEVVKVPWSMSVSQLQHLLEAKRITGAPVIDDIGKLIGVVSETDIMRLDPSHPPEGEAAHSYFTSSLDERDPFLESPTLEESEETNEKTVEDIMTPWTVSVGEETLVTEIARIMVEKRIHRVLVVDQNSQLKGIVTTMDIARAVSESR